MIWYPKFYKHIVIVLSFQIPLVLTDWYKYRHYLSTTSLIASLIRDFDFNNFYCFFNFHCYFFALIVSFSFFLLIRLKKFPLGIPSDQKQVYSLWKEYSSPWREGTLNCKLRWYPKIYNHVILFVGPKKLCALIEMWLNGYNFSTISLIYILFIIIWDIYQFIFHCLIS